MNYSINQRVKEYKEAKRLKQVELATAISTTGDRVSKWFRLEEKIPAEYVLAIVTKFPDINARWLLTGEGEMFEKGTTGVANEPVLPYKITRIDCPECISKKNEIDALKQALDAKEELLHMYRNKKKDVS